MYAYVVTTPASPIFTVCLSPCRYWLARRNKYKTSILFCDDCTNSSSLVQAAIDANSGEIRPQVTVSYQGTPTHGFYQWVNFTALGGSEAYDCDLIQVSIDVIVSLGPSVSSGLNVQRNTELPFEVSFEEGQFPIDTVVVITVGSASTGATVEVFRGNIDEMIQTNQDVYIRGTDLDGVSGFAYTTTGHDYAVFGASCDQAPESGAIELFEW